MASLDRGIYRLLLRLYPPDFRRDHGAELEALYEHCLRVERSRRGALRARLSALGDALRGAWSLRRRTRARQAGLRGSLRAFVHDGRLAVRTWRRAPGFFGGVVIVLALGIGANGAVFSLVQAVLLEPLPYQDPDRLVRLTRTTAAAGARQSGTTAAAIHAWREASAGALTGVAGVKSWAGNLEAQFDLVTIDRAERLRGALVTANFFEVLGARPALGRLFTAEDDARGDTNLVVLSHALWRRAFASDPAIVGRTITLTAGRRDRGPKPFAVVGVLPPAFKYSYPVETELWTIYDGSRINAANDAAIEFNGAVGRLAPGVSFESAATRLRPVTPGRARPEIPEADRPITHVEPLTEWVVGQARPSLMLLSGVAALLLVIACATVASALLVRLAERRRELAVRASLGAHRGRLVRQLLAEGAVLSGVGTAAGIALSAALLPVFRALVPPLVPRADELAVDWWLLAFAAAAATVVTLLAAMVPALHGSRLDLMSAVRASSGTSASRSARRWRVLLVGVQTAIATCLLIGATLLLVSFRQLGRVELGYDGQDVLTVEMRLLDPRYFAPDGRLARFQTDLMARIRAIPGVTEAGMTTAVPFRGVDFVRIVRREPEAPSVAANERTVDAGYFEVMRMPLRRGRLFGPEDRPESPPVAIVSESLARSLFGDDDPIGRTIDSSGPTTVIGVVSDARYAGLENDPFPALYTARSQDPTELICLVIRSQPGADVGDAVRAAVRAVDPNVPAMQMTTIDRIIGDSVADRRFYTTTTTAFASLALLLTAAGLIVVVSRSVVERRREMAIRLALGARGGRLVRQVTADGLRPVALGLLGGVLSGWWAARLIEPFLFGVAVREPWVFGVAAAIVLGVAGAACLWPARRLGRIAPALVLRHD